jgi:hypothetical protein
MYELAMNEAIEVAALSKFSSAPAPFAPLIVDNPSCIRTIGTVILPPPRQLS